jgi:hypothetical protein
MAMGTANGWKGNTNQGLAHRGQLRIGRVEVVSCRSPLRSPLRSLSLLSISLVAVAVVLFSPLRHDAMAAIKFLSPDYAPFWWLLFGVSACVLSPVVRWLHGRG